MFSNCKELVRQSLDWARSKTGFAHRAPAAVKIIQPDLLSKLNLTGLPIEMKLHGIHSCGVAESNIKISSSWRHSTQKSTKLTRNTGCPISMTVVVTGETLQTKSDAASDNGHENGGALGHTTM